MLFLQRHWWRCCLHPTEAIPAAVSCLAAAVFLCGASPCFVRAVPPMTPPGHSATVQGLAGAAACCLSCSSVQFCATWAMHQLLHSPWLHCHNSGHPNSPAVKHPNRANAISGSVFTAVPWWLCHNFALVAVPQPGLVVAPAAHEEYRHCCTSVQLPPLESCCADLSAPLLPQRGTCCYSSQP